MKSRFLKGIYILIVAVIGFFIVLLAKGNFKPASFNPVDLSTAGDTISVLSVGQADSTLISSGGKYCLVDAGHIGESHTGVVKYLENARISEIELLVITHFHTDHTSELLDVMNNFKIKTIVIPDLSKDNMPTNSFFTAFLDKVEKYGIELKPAAKGDVYQIGNGTVAILDNTYNDLTVNDTSVATLFTQGDFTWLNTGDGEAEYEQRLLENFDSTVTLFTAGHHGSSTSNTEEFIKTIRPEYVAVSAGKDNEYGHPHTETVKLFEKYNAKYNITFRDGTLIYSITDKKPIEYREG
ncbi:MAG: MBL fold metallo-hydrolase [Ruminococcaceae bacterium]|nr:MBL fold metallo-hydrolase [Oscillospiraceae bacterium]